jgi:hypothetical protein
MKKRGIIFVFFVSLIFLISFALSATTPATTTTNTNAKAYSCLNNLVTGKCSTLTSEEKIFSLLSVEACKTEVLSDSLSSQCWPVSGCKIKTTAQAILALSHVNTNTTSAEAWLLSQKMNFQNINWLLQVEATNATSCTATYSGGTHTFSINDDKTLTNAGSCLSVYNDYWLKISPNCYNTEIKISCKNYPFLTSLLYQRTGSSTVYVSETTNFASAGGTTTEMASSFCFKEGNSCSYEGTLWAALVLKYKGYDVSSYLPYLISSAETNSQFIPYSFIYSLTNNFRTELLSQQQQSQFWSASGDKFYDTAIALLPFANEPITEKTNSITWLLSVQGTDGCWNDNVRDTAILLYSLWPKPSSTSTANQDCEASGYFCMPIGACTAAGGNILPTTYVGCFSTNKCCDKNQQLQSCSDQNGIICASGQTCSGRTLSSSTSGTCCVGTCVTPSEKSECEKNNGNCRSTCLSDEQFSSYVCNSGNCCVTKTSEATSGNLWIIIVLAILIILVLIGILFRKKLRDFFSRLKFGKGKAKPSGYPPSSPQRPYPVQRRIIPQQQRPPSRRPQPRSDFDEVLKKLKEIGK